MRTMRWAAFCWPGLASLWMRGSWSALFVAVAFGLLLNVVLAATWVWNELLGRDMSASLWSAVGAVWLTLVLISLRKSHLSDYQPHDEADTYATALTEYLRGNWLDAEILARQLLAEQPTDIESGLLLAAVLRHTSRFDEARAILDDLTRWDRATPWQFEIDGEYRLLAEKERDLEEERKMQSMEAVTIPLPNLREAA